MLDPITLDQLRAFITVVEEGSFSAAARKLQRVQSAVSTAMANLESQLGVSLWDRSTKVATLTEQGHAVLAAARRVCGEVDSLRKLTGDMSRGLEATVSLCVEVLYPLTALVDLCEAFSKTFPSVDLRIDTQTLSAVSARVLDGSATLGVASPVGVVAGLESHVLAPIRMIPVVAPTHPLAAHDAPIPTSVLAGHIQIVLSERHDSGVPDQGVLSPRTWRIADLHAKHAMLRAGLGWGNLPEHIARDDLREGRLVPLRLRAWGEDEHLLSLSAIYRTDRAIGPAHRWVIENLEVLCKRDVVSPEAQPAGQPESPPEFPPEPASKRPRARAARRA
ncbi:Transcriptional regulator, LysR family [Chondromyces apiculatus DSM 436]|uniref:Transcriptional regulator, LysR family n=1 Tax=Chondromyces apiculatus DSM 436 TaxID=1192034 RepID=A0A017TDP9_9BACT|nr:Transcriptional regulator, LysR family [Chondromyces apiculatus DSM 436]